ncbi:MAG: hypothetical protein J5818_00335 [Eggerthellaceae bacterium]|nr:hypothetical protein [Eggerthellaceae bacterium]
MGTEQENTILTALGKLEQIKIEEQKRIGYRLFTLADVLLRYGGGTKEFSWRYSDNKRSIYYEIDGEERCSEVFYDELSGERSAFIVLPLEYIHHDPLINPRPVNLNLEGLIREFGGGNPQLQQSLARIDGNVVRIFDGQHKTVARILLGEREILMRLFLETDPAKLMETNTRAGRQLKQIEFDARMETKVTKSLFQLRLQQYREEHGIAEDDQSFLTDELIDELLGGMAR